MELKLYEPYDKRCDSVFKSKLFNHSHTTYHTH